jgi:hypothetical protein
MNAPNQWYQDEADDNNDYEVHMRREASAPEMKSKRRVETRTKNRPSNSNGIHRRHNKRWSW